MVTSAVFIALAGTLLFKCAISAAAIHYEPIKITVNENFNSQPGQVFQELESLEPGIVHQGANFYFKPQLNLPPSYVPPHIEDLISLIQQYHRCCTKDTSKVAFENDKLMEILKPFMYRSSDIPKENLLRNENNSENIKPLKIISSGLEEISTKSLVEPMKITEEPKPVTPELLIIPEAPVLSPPSLNNIPSVVEDVKKEESIILEEATNVFPTISEISARPIQKPIISYVEPKSVTPELRDIPEAPVLPPLSLNNIPTVAEGVKKEESIILEEPTDVFPTISEISARPMQEPIISYDEPKSVTPELGAIPEAPVLPSLSLNHISSVVEDVKKEESIISEEPTNVFPTIQEISVSQEPINNIVELKPVTPELLDIPEAPVLLPFSLNDIHGVEQEVKSETPILEPVIIEVESIPVTPELGPIPEAPVLSPLSLNNIPFVNEDIKKEKSGILEEPTNVVFPTISDISPKPIQEPIINYVKPVSSELEIIPKAPVLPPYTLNNIHVVEQKVKGENPILKPAIIEIESIPVTPKLGPIPEAPVLPSLSLINIPSVVEDVKKDESIIVEEPTGVFPSISEISARPMQEPIISYVEPKTVTPELGAIPKAPVLPPLSLNNIPSFVEDVKKEGSIKLEEPTNVFPTIQEISVSPLQESINNDIEPKPVFSELEVISKAPMSFSLNDIDVVKQKVKGENPILEPTIIEVESKPITPELGPIPEAPALPPLSLFNNSSDFEDVKKEEPIILGEPTGLFPTIPKISARPMQEPIKNYVELQPAIPDIGAIPEAPVLPPLSLNNISSVVEDVKKEESIILEEPTNVFSTIPEISVSPMQEPIINYVELKPITSELEIIPEAPVLPPLSLNNISSVVEDVKKEESIILEDATNNVFSTIPEIYVSPIQEPIINYIELKPIISELEVIPEVSVLPRFSPNDLHVIEKEVKIEEPITLEDSTDVFPIIQEMSIRPIPESIFTEIEPKSATPRPIVIPEASVLPPQSHIRVPPTVEEVKIEESINVGESTGVFPAFPKISAILEPAAVSETAESFPLENNSFPNTTNVKIIPILVEDSIEEYPQNAESFPGMTFQEPEITNSYVLEEVLRPNPFTKGVVTVRETLPPTNPSNNPEAFSYVPFVSHLSNRAPNSKPPMIPKPASIQRFLHKEHPFRLPVMPFPKLSPSISGYNKQFLLPRNYAHNIVEKRIAPNMGFQNNAPKLVRFSIRSNVPKKNNNQ